MAKKPKPPSKVHVDVTVVPAAALPCSVSLECADTILRQTTNADGWCRFDVPREWRNTQLTVLTDSADWQDFGQAILLDGQPHEAPSQFWVTLQPVIVPDPPQPPVLDAGERGPLHIDGLAFRRQDGSVFPWRGNSDFSLYHRFLLGQDFSLLLDERVAVGSNILRVFGMYDGAGIGTANGLGTFNPKDFPNYYAMIVPFLDVVNGRGLRVEFVIFADTAVLMPNKAERAPHAQKVIDAVALATGPAHSV